MQINFFERHTSTLVHKNAGSILQYNFVKSSIDIKKTKIIVELKENNNLLVGDFIVMKLPIFTKNLVGVVASIKKHEDNKNSKAFEIELLLNEDMIDDLVVPLESSKYNTKFIESLNENLGWIKGEIPNEGGTGIIIRDSFADMPLIIIGASNQYGYVTTGGTEKTIGFDKMLRNIMRNQLWKLSPKMENDIIKLELIKKTTDNIVKIQEAHNIVMDLKINFTGESINKMTVKGLTAPPNTYPYARDYALLNDGNVVINNNSNLLRIQPVLYKEQWFEQYTVNQETGEVTENPYKDDTYVEQLKNQDYNNEISFSIALDSKLFDLKNLETLLNQKINIILTNGQEIRSIVTEVSHASGNTTLAIKCGTERIRLTDKLQGWLQ